MKNWRSCFNKQKMAMPQCSKNMVTTPLLLPSSSLFIVFTGPVLKKIIADSNAAALEKGLDALLAFIDRCDTVPQYVHLLLVC
jgi:hypothetical protein